MQWLLDNIVCYFQAALYLAVNGVVAALGALASALFLALPDMPAEPPIPADIQNALSHADYYLPLTFVLELAVITSALWLAIFIVKIPLRWARVVE